MKSRKNGDISAIEVSFYWDQMDVDISVFSDPYKMAERLWLYLTNDNLPELATIKKDAFLFEVSTMLDIAIQISVKGKSELPKHQ